MLLFCSFFRITPVVLSQNRIFVHKTQFYMVWFFTCMIVVLWLVGKIPFVTKSGIKPLYLRILLLIKVAAGSMVMLVYSNYYPKDTADLYNYLNDGEILYSALEKSPTDYVSMLTGIGDERPHLLEYYDSMSYWIKPFDYNLYNDNKIVIRFNAFFRLFSFGNIHIHNLLFNVLSFIGLIALFRFLGQHYSTRRRVLLLLTLFFVPTLLFWGSGILKESVLLFAFGLTIWSMGELLKKPFSKWHLAIFLFSATLFVHTKIYVVLSVISGIFFLLWARFRQRKLLLSFLIVHILIAVAAFNLQYFGSGYDIVSLISSKQKDFINMITLLTQAGSAVELPLLDGTVWGLVKAAPVGFFNALFRPHIFEFHNIMSFAAALENLFLLVFIVLGLFFSRRQNFYSSTVLFSLSFTIILLIITGITTPVLGALVRYKLPALPFIYALIITVIDYRQFEKTMRYLHRKRMAEASKNLLSKLANCFFILNER